MKDTKGTKGTRTAARETVRYPCGKHPRYRTSDAWTKALPAKHIAVMGKDRRERRAAEGKEGKGKEVAAGVDNTHRRTWNKDDYAEKAAERDKKVGCLAPCAVVACMVK